MVFYQPWEYGRDNEPVDTFFHAPELANDYGICTMELAAMIHWLFRCFQEGTLNEEDTGLPLAKIGTQEFLEKLLHLITYRGGLGDILAEGLIRAVDKVPIATRTAFHNLSSIGHIDGIPPRVFFAHALIYPFEPRMHPLALHELSWVRWAWLHNLEYPQESPITSRVVHDIAKVYWGSEEAGDFATYEGKALAAKRIQNRCYIKDSLGLCDMGWTFAYSLSTPDHVRDPDLEAKIFEAVTGVRQDNINTYGDRIFNLQRAILLREGRKIPDADYPNELNFTQPFGVNEEGRKMLIPGRTEGVIDTTGNILDRQKFTVMLKEFYRLRGWDEDTGTPLLQTLTGLGLDDLIGCFPGSLEAR